METILNGSDNLYRLQAAFSRAILDGRYDPNPGWVRKCSLKPRQRLNVYYHQHRIVQLEALQGIYPAVRRLVGDIFFADLAVRYGDRFPLRSGDVRTFGPYLPDFMETFEPLVSLPYLPDVARLEWACHESLHSGKPTLPPALKTRTPLRLSAHVRLLHSAYPVARIWEFALNDPRAGSPRLDIEGAGPDHLLIMRPQLDVEVYKLPADEWAWLNRFSSDKTAPSTTFDTNEGSRCQEWLSKGALTQ